MPGMAIAGGIQAAGGLVNGLMGSSAAKNAASVQEKAANRAATLQSQVGQEGNQYQIQQNQQNRADELPYLQSGTNGLATLDYLLGINGAGSAGASSGGVNVGIPGQSGSVTTSGVTPVTGTPNTQAGGFGSLLQGYSGGEFKAPTAAEAAASPGEQFAESEGQKAMQASAAANGSLLTGGTMMGLNAYGQNLANTNYNNVYNQGYNAALLSEYGVGGVLLKTPSGQWIDYDRY